MTRALIVIAVIAIWFASGILTEYGPARAQQPPQMPPPPGAPHGVLPPPEGAYGQPAPPPMSPQPPPDVIDPDFCRQLRATFQDYDQERQNYFAPYLKRCIDAGM
jgi:hypothetical protein